MSTCKGLSTPCISALRLFRMLLDGFAGSWSGSAEQSFNAYFLAYWRKPTPYHGHCLPCELCLVQVPLSVVSSN